MDQRIEPLDFLFQMLSFTAHQGERDLDFLLFFDQDLGARGENGRQNPAHAISKVDVPARLSSLAFERIPLPVHFGENIVYPRQILPGGLEAGLGDFPLRLEFGNAGRFFDEPAPVRRLGVE